LPRCCSEEDIDEIILLERHLTDAGREAARRIVAAADKQPKAVSADSSNNNVPPGVKKIFPALIVLLPLGLAAIAVAGELSPLVPAATETFTSGASWLARFSWPAWVACGAAVMAALLAIGMIARIFLHPYYYGRLQQFADRKRAVGDNLEALVWYDRVLKHYPGSFAALVGRGRVYMNFGRYDLAVKDFTAAAAHTPLTPEVYLLRAQANFGRGYYDAALQDCRDMQSNTRLEYGYERAEGLKLIASIFLIRGEFGKAETALKRVTETNICDREARERLGLVQQLVRIKAAIASEETVLSVPALAGLFFELLAVVQSPVLTPLEARSVDFAVKHAIDPSNPVYLAEWGRKLWGEAHTYEALLKVQAALQHAPGDPALHELASQIDEDLHYEGEEPLPVLPAGARWRDLFTVL